MHKSIKYQFTGLIIKRGQRGQSLIFSSMFVGFFESINILTSRRVDIKKYTYVYETI